MKKIILLICLGISSVCFAGSSALQNITLSSGIITTLSLINATTVDLTVRTAQAGSGLITSSKLATEMCISTNQINQKLIAYLNTNTPNQTILELTVDSAPGINLTPSILSNSPTDLLTHISNVNCASTKISFKYSADVNDGVILEDTYTVTYILTDM